MSSSQPLWMQYNIKHKKSQARQSGRRVKCKVRSAKRKMMHPTGSVISGLCREQFSAFPTTIILYFAFRILHFRSRPQDVVVGPVEEKTGFLGKPNLSGGAKLQNRFKKSVPGGGKYFLRSFFSCSQAWKKRLQRGLHNMSCYVNKCNQYLNISC